MRFSFLPKKIHAIVFGIFLASVVGFFAFTPLLNRVDAQGSSSYTHQGTYTTEAEREHLERLFTVRMFLHDTLSALTCEARGIEPIDPTIDCMTLDRETAQEGSYKSGGLITFAGDAIGMLFAPPASFQNYSKSLASDFGIAKKATAAVDCAASPNDPTCTAGSGYQGLSQLQNMWVLMRNIAYMLLVVVFVVIGVAIMLRVKIDPRTVMTIQNQIPKLIVAILLITFSYSIVGLLIDAMWVTTYFGINLVTESVPCEDAANNGSGGTNTFTTTATTQITDSPISFTTSMFGDKTGCFGSWDGISGLATDVGFTLSDALARILPGAISGDSNNFSCDGILPGGEDFDFSSCASLVFTTIVKYIVGILAVLIVWIAILFSLFRLWFSLLKNYILLLIDILLSPIFLLLSVMPGSSLSISGWIRNIIAQLAVFPAAALLLVTAAVIASDPTINNPGSDVFVPPLIGNSNIGDNLGMIIAFGFILLTPQLLDTIREALKSPAAKQSGGVTAMMGLATGRVTGSISGAGERLGHRNEAVSEYDSSETTGMKWRRKGYGNIFGWRPGGS